jgi:hypothetical protein
MDEKKLDETADEAVDQSFNDDELQDIMNEIEDLEKEFGGDSTSEEEMVISKPKKTELQDKIDQELEAVANAMIPEADDSPEENVVAMENSTLAATPSPTSENGAHMDFSGSGQMNFNLDFNIGEHTAHLKVDGSNGFVVEMSGVYIHINEEHGCTVEMSGGVKFNVPFPAGSTKKAA